MGKYSNKGNFKKGDPRINRKGMNRLSEQTKAIRKLTLENVSNIIEKYLLANPDKMFQDSEYDKIKGNKKMTVLEAGICRALRRDVTRGKIDTITELLNRLGIKPIENNNPDDSPKPIGFKFDLIDKEQ